jgi:transcription initiation factor IIE alpha subunit
MPHEHVQLAQAPNGEIGPRCNKCGMRLTFGSAMVHNEHYYCWECYVELTGADSVTEVKTTEQKFYIKK